MSRKEPEKAISWQFALTCWLMIGTLVVVVLPETERSKAVAILAFFTTWAIGVVIYTAYLSAEARIRRGAVRPPLHICKGCGYDVRANDERCPECGAFLPVTSAQVEALAKMVAENPPPGSDTQN